MEKEYDYINPSHYKNSSKETWQQMVDIWGIDAYIKHCEMCAFKYRMRLGTKPDQPVERDLAKVKWYEDKAKELKRVKLDLPVEDSKKFIDAFKHLDNSLTTTLVNSGCNHDFSHYQGARPHCVLCGIPMAGWQ